MKRTLRIALFVVDTGPLITLAAAGALDHLLAVADLKIIIPDAVFYEATFDSAKLGATDIIEWAKLNHERIEIAPTNAFVVAEAAKRTLPNLRSSDLGERAAVEVIREDGRLRNDNERAVLLCEEIALFKKFRVDDVRQIVLVSTMDFLGLLEGARRIQSAQVVFEMAVAAGRTPSNHQYLIDEQNEAFERVAELVRLTRSP